MDSPPGPPLVLYDGWCNLCSATVSFILRHDRHARFRFAALQSAAARSILPDSGVVGADEESVVVILAGKRLDQSQAVLAILQRLPLPWSVLGLLVSLVPRPIRDWAYRIIARHRRRWFGQRQTCQFIDPAYHQRFLE
jgi:predicted DCC family thiol-disulfide oxidoreductase YuxK